MFEQRLPYRPEIYSEAMRQVILTNPPIYSNVLIEGRDAPTMFDTFTGVFPSIAGDMLDYFYLTLTDIEMNQQQLTDHTAAVRAKIINMTLPDRPRSIRTEHDQQATDRYLNHVSKIGYVPFVFVTFGHVVRGDPEEATTLWHPPMMSTQYALSLLQEHARNRSSRLS
jgi:hypothetical protein